MKTLGAWIAGIFALGLMLGSLVSGSGAVPEIADSDAEAALDKAPLLQQVDCGDGREALLEPVDTDGTTVFKVRCVPIEGEPPTPVATERAREASTPEVAPTPPSPEPQLPDANVDMERDDVEPEGRTWKESAVVIGGAAGAGAGIGAIAKGKKGAAVGAAIGAASGAAYELIKKDKKN